MSPVALKCGLGPARFVVAKLVEIDAEPLGDLAQGVAPALIGAVPHDREELQLRVALVSHAPEPSRA